MSNTYATCSIIAKESLAVLENMLGFSQNVNRDFETEYSSNMSRGYAPGQTINIKKPPRYTYRAGRVAVPQLTTQATVPLTLSQGGADLNFTSLERTLSIVKLEDMIAAAMAPIANEIDRQGLTLAHYSTYNAVGTVGTFPTTQATAFSAIASVNQKLDEIEQRIDRKLDEIDRRLGEWRDKEIANRIKILKITLWASVIVGAFSLIYSYVVQNFFHDRSAPPGQIHDTRPATK